MIQNVGLWAAFGAGILSFFSPCLLPLIPGYLMFLTGGYTEKSQRKTTLFQTFGFIIGFTSVFILLGISASTLGRLLLTHQALLTKISGFTIAFFGLLMLDLFYLPFLSKDHRKQKQNYKATFFGAIGLGMAFAFGWTPCFGPILGAILAYTSYTSTDVTHGVLLLSIYSLGMAVPFLITAWFIDFFEQKLHVFSKSTGWLKKLAGIIMIVIGVLMFLGKLSAISNLFY